MDMYYFLAIILLGLATIVFCMYKYFFIKKISIRKDKLQPKISLVIIAKNNQSLIKYMFDNIVRASSRDTNLREILVIDLGSIDNTYEIASKYLKSYPAGKLVSLNHVTSNVNYYNLIKGYVSGDIVISVDLNKISMTNPNVYIPDLFKAIDIFDGGFPGTDARIDGTKLLIFDKLEREKNSYVLKEHLTENLFNILMRIEAYAKNCNNSPGILDEQLNELLEYVNNSAKKAALLTRIMGVVDYIEQDLEENMLVMFKDYSYSHHVSINYKALGFKKKFKEPVNELMLRVIQDLLCAIVQFNLISSIDVLARYGRKRLNILIRYKCEGDNNLMNAENKLSYYVISSIQNRLNIVGGYLKVNIDKGIVKVFMQLPIDQTTISDGESGLENEKNILN